MGNIGFTELALILVIALLVFGPKKLPDLARSLGRSVREFRQAAEEVTRDWNSELESPPPDSNTTSTQPLSDRQNGANKVENPEQQ